MDSKTTSTQRPLGKTGIQVSPVGLGVMQFSGRRGFFRFFMSDITQADMYDILRAALEGGINWFDTAEFYGGGHSERGLSSALKNLHIPDSEVVIGTKWFPLFRTARNIPNTIDERLQNLDGYTIDLYMVHNPMSFSSVEAEMAAMADLVKTGKVLSIGVSNFNAEQMRRAHAALAERGLPLAVNQVEYSLLNREIESNGVLETARELSVAVVAYTPLGYGLLSGKYHSDPDRLNSVPRVNRMRFARQIEHTRPIVDMLKTIAGERQVTPGQVALNWVINSQGDTVLAIPGASRSAQARENAGAMEFSLSEAEIDQLSQVSDGL